ncbi:hypothetical protein HYU07_07905 [Candidatus Woesearchaeota archaeon]|nr:hypothetical protein [Candidatus Woesearchaeota archaeon]
MASVTFAVDGELRSRIGRFSWVNWSEVAREDLIKKEEIEELHRKLESKEEQKFIKWSVELGRKAKKGRFKRLLAELSPEERRELLR